MKKIIILFLSGALFSCHSDNVSYNYPENPDLIRNQRAGKFFDDITLFDGNKKGKTEKTAPKKTENAVVQNPLWSASLEVIGGLLPIAIADSNSGLITTEWYSQNQNQYKRIKINLLVKGKEINKNNLALSIFKQSQDKKGNWKDEKADDQTLTADLIKEKIIDKANSLSSK